MKELEVYEVYDRNGIFWPYGRIGKQAQIDFKDPDRIIIVETVENRAGVGLIMREMKEKSLLIKVK